jgi:hypothetical protein
MPGKKTSGSKKPARKKKVPLTDLSSPSQELSEGQARAVKGGGDQRLTENVTLNFAKVKVAYEEQTATSQT